MEDKKSASTESFIFRIDAWLKKAAKSIFKGPASRVRLLTLVVLVLGVVAGAYVAPVYVNQGVGWIKTKTGFTLPALPQHTGFRLGLDLQGGSSLIYQADMKAVPPGQERDSLEGVRDVIERRVNAFGVSEPLVQTSISGGNYRVIVELAGIKDIKEAIKQIGETPILEFKTQSNEPSRPMTDEEKKTLEKTNAAAAVTANDVEKQVLAKPDSFADLAKKYSEDTGSKDKGGDIGYVTRESVVKEFGDEIFDKLKVGEITKAPIKTAYGYHIIKKTGEKEADVNGAKAKEVSASHILILTRSESDVVPLEQWKGTGLTGKQLKHAAVQFDPQTGQPDVGLQFNTEGADLFATITGANVGKPIAIYLDGSIISAPNVSQKIVGGQAVISGNFTVQEAKQLAQRLNAGALPVPVTLISQRTVGATLGEASLERSLFAGLLGFLIVALFMIAFYRFPGLLATLALLIYTALALSIFKLANVTMTLAGIAGVILSIGMAVDANILIFERIKEEVRRGRSTAAAVDEGFRRAWNSIRDSNFSSLITCVILYWFGTSVVRGFAFTLAIGVLVSMFSAITVTRTFMRLAMGGWAEKHLWLFGAKRAPTPSQ